MNSNKKDIEEKNDLSNLTDDKIIELYLQSESVEIQHEIDKRNLQSKVDEKYKELASKFMS